MYGTRLAHIGDLPAHPPLFRAFVRFRFPVDDLGHAIAIQALKVRDLVRVDSFLFFGRFLLGCSGRAGRRGPALATRGGCGLAALAFGDALGYLADGAFDHFSDSLFQGALGGTAARYDQCDQDQQDRQELNSARHCVPP